QNGRAAQPQARQHPSLVMQGEAGLPLQTPTEPVQTVAAFPPAVGDGQRLAAFGHNSIGPAEPGLPPTLHPTCPDREYAVRLRLQALVAPALAHAALDAGGA